MAENPEHQQHSPKPESASKPGKRTHEERERDRVSQIDQSHQDNAAMTATPELSELGKLGVRAANGNCQLVRRAKRGKGEAKASPFLFARALALAIAQLLQVVGKS